jgi:VWFA-related protein
MRISAALLLLVGIVHSGAGPTAAPQQAGSGAAAAAGQDGGQAAQGSAPAESPQRPTFRGGIDFVRVDAVVTRDGRPVLDLEAADFEIFEDGKPREIEQFRMIRIDGTRPPDENVTSIRAPIDEELEAQREDVRLFVFFLDDYHTRNANARTVRAPLIRFIETQLLPSDMLAIMYPLTPVNDVIFTRDHAQVADAISRFEGRKYDYTPRNTARRTSGFAARTKTAFRRVAIIFS